LLSTLSGGYRRRSAGACTRHRRPAEGAARDEKESAARKARLEDDNLDGETAREVERERQLDWDDWKDVHRRGEGNRLNHG